MNLGGSLLYYNSMKFKFYLQEESDKGDARIIQRSSPFNL